MTSLSASDKLYFGRYEFKVELPHDYLGNISDPDLCYRIRKFLLGVNEKYYKRTTLPSYQIFFLDRTTFYSFLDEFEDDIVAAYGPMSQAHINLLYSKLPNNVVIRDKKWFNRYDARLHIPVSIIYNGLNGYTRTSLPNRLEVAAFLKDNFGDVDYSIKNDYIYMNKQDAEEVLVFLRMAKPNWISSSNKILLYCKLIKEDIMDKVRIYEQLKIDEGVVYEIYLDHLGYPTFGVGHLITENDIEHGLPVGTSVDEERVFECFEKDLNISISECEVLYGKDQFNNWPTEVQEILVNMMFNMGRPRLSKFKNFRAALERFDWSTAADEMVDSLWYRQVGDRAKRLEERMRAV